jgi:hypothetical protein
MRRVVLLGRLGDAQADIAAENRVLVTEQIKTLRTTRLWTTVSALASVAIAGAVLWSHSKFRG